MNSYPAAIYEDLKNTRSILEKITYYNKFKNNKHYHEYLPKGLEKPLSDGIIDYIQKVWVLPNDDTRIYIIHEYVKMYKEIEKYKEELRVLRLPPPKKLIDEEIAELQTRIMALYAEKGKN